MFRPLSGICLLVAFVVCSRCPGTMMVNFQSANTPLFPSNDTLLGRISTELGNGRSPETLFSTQVFSDMAQHGDVRQWLRLIDSRDPDLQMIGLKCILDREPKSGFLAAIRYVIAAPRVSMPHVGFAIETIQQGRSEAVAPAEIVSFLDHPLTSHDARMILTSAFTDKDLASVFDEVRRQESSVNTAALIVEEIAQRETLDGIVRSPEYQEELKFFVKYPGYPRLVYLFFTMTNANQDLPLIKDVLLDSSLSDAVISAIVDKYASVYRTEITEYAKQAPSPRMESILRMLDSR